MDACPGSFRLMMTITLEEDGRMVLPEVLRRGLHIGKGAKLAAAVVGDHIELKPYGESGVAAWPPGFFDRIAIDDPSFTRPAQGEMPEGVVL